jgi:16S rRNA (guanine966-N2)-methyltransferase
VRKAVFDVLKNLIYLIYIEGAKVADLFCGSGMYGLEAISRGAGSVWFVDESKNIIEQLKKNVNILNIKDYDIKIINKKFEVFIKSCAAKFDLVFADPPYYQFDFEKLNEIHKILNKNGIFVLEQSKRGSIKELNGLELFLEKKYGDTVVCFYKNGNI